MSQDDQNDPRATPPVAHDAEVGDKFAPHHPSHEPRYAAPWIITLLALGTLGFAGLGVHELWQKREFARHEARRLTGGDPDRGVRLLRPFGCAGCHQIPGVVGANGTIGPPLAGIATRMYVGGVVTNTPDNMVRWIVNPKAIDDKSAMPAVGVSERQARDIAAYLYTLR